MRGVIELLNHILIGGALIVIVAGTVCIAGVLLLAVQSGNIESSGLGVNDGAVTSREFIRLVDAAERNMIIHDDGNKVEDSIYDDPKVIEALRRNLDRSPRLCVYCLFNDDEPDLLLRGMAREHPRLEVRVRKDQPQYREEEIRSHYKLIDNGLQAYLSWHAHGERERMYRTVDCSMVAKPFRSLVARNALGEYLDRFKLEYANASVAS